MKMNWLYRLTLVSLISIVYPARGDIQSDINALGANGGTVPLPGT